VDHRKVSKDIGRIQEVDCALSPCRIMGTDWMKILVTHLIQISHSQWILQKFTLHDRHCGYLRLKQCRDLLREVNSLLETTPEEVPEGSWYLLELDFLVLYNTSFEQQSYWALAMKAARWAGRRIVQTTRCNGHYKKCRAATQRKPSHPKYDFTRDKKQMRHKLGLDLNSRQ
jgi:hypothetical protein